MKQLSSLALLALVLAGCTTVITAHQLDEKLGPADPGRYDAPVLPVAPAPDYRTQVRPILDRRCVSCHACYDSPCQLNLSRYDGITRGARPDSVYFRHQRDNPLPVDVLVVDEVSMVGLALMAKTVDALPPTARLILLGDKDQLASVEAGAVLGDLCFGGGRFAPFGLEFADHRPDVAG